MVTDASLARYDLNSSNFLDAFAGLPTDVILAVSFFVSILLVGWYFYFRSRQAV